MPKSLAQARETAGIKPKLAGKALKDYLVENEVALLVVEVSADDGDYGPSWKVGIDPQDDMPDHVDTIWFPMEPNRDEEFAAMGDATVADPYGPLVLTRAGKRGYYKFVDVQ